ncbi:MAG: DNA mismatch repair protein mutS [Candidatus Xenolissoclinum pacificiensis L6]|uniref:DNA mismatch repair protein MutS n=1 Tax=Candidatus Xenolissoclinum pacificiensis L6 TaxID=1401685 RepID=W2V045_9RICK|nr:MAG: DNA mismatch repair protein mutS [Candidatus Xenolissoclinum pacificiensis L6]
MKKKIDKKISITEHYFSIKKQYNDAILFYRLGDFYEIFGEDAIKVSKILSIVLTHRGKLQNSRVEMCGVPHHSSRVYISKLLKSGLKVAICEQMESAEEAKSRGCNSVIKREVVRVFTPGTAIDDDMISNDRNNYIVSIVIEKEEIFSIAYVDISSKDFFYQSQISYQELYSVLVALHPSESLLSDKLAQDTKISHMMASMNIMMTSYDESYFSYNRSRHTILEHYSIADEKVLDIPNRTTLCAIGSIIEYIVSTQIGNMYVLDYPINRQEMSRMSIDASVIKSLELFETVERKHKGSVISTLDRTITVEGKRLLKTILLNPLCVPEDIEARLDVVEYYVQNTQKRILISELLSEASDLERLVSRFVLGYTKPYDLVLLKHELQNIISISKLMESNISNNPSLLQGIYENLSFSHELFEKLCRFVNDNIEKNADSYYVNITHHEKLNLLNEKVCQLESQVQGLMNEYRNDTGIIGLKITNNNLIGYYVEVPVKYEIKDERFIRKQGLSQVTRYTTVELIQLESEIIACKIEYKNLENEVLSELSEEVKNCSEVLYRLARNRAYLDVLISFSSLSTCYDFVRPVLDNSLSIDIIGGQHPSFLDVDNFMVNDLRFSDDNNISILTGPNMAGKSTFLRQNMMIIIMAQSGMFVPAKSARIGIVDKIFSRVGAYDNISRGYSTFMIEMVETAFILNNATDRSFIILDEVGRGTSLYDGLAIAQSTIEYLLLYSKSRVLFATHYKELSDLATKHKLISCLCLNVKVDDGKMYFTYKVKEGVSDKSYGIYVAKLAGAPKFLLERAQEILSKYELSE